MKKIGVFFLSSLFAITALFFIAAAVLPLPGTIPVLVYRYIGTAEEARQSKDFVSQKSFERQMAFLKRFGYRIISLDDFYEIQTGKKKPRGREIVLTFDDAGKNFEEHALPVLEKFRFPAGIFIVSEKLRRGREDGFSENRLEKFLDQNKITAGSHSKTHPYLSELSEERVRDEIADSKQDLETLLGSPVRYFSYPAGPLTEATKALTQETGYWLAFSSNFKELNKREDAYSIVRVKITRTADYPFVYWFKISGIYQMFKRERYYLKHPAADAPSLP